jgi:hypothetical protein
MDGLCTNGARRDVSAVRIPDSPHAACSVLRLRQVFENESSRSLKESYLH